LLGQWGMLVMSFYFGGRTLEKIMDMKAKKWTYLQTLPSKS
jgi:hypothetical protein